MKPLADRIRPQSLDQFVGQKHLVGKNKPIRLAIDQDKIFSMIFWGPPGCGKTTLARIIARQTGSEFKSLSAVSAGKDDVRKIVNYAQDEDQQKLLDQKKNNGKEKFGFASPYVDRKPLMAAPVQPNQERS
jgi:putative ATPase